MAVPQQAHTDPMDWTVPVLLTGYFTMHPAANIYWVTAVELPPSTDTVNRSDGGEAQPGDLVFYPDDSHIGIVGLRDVTGNLLIIHCASGANNVVITDSSGFMLVGRPLYYGE